MPGWLKILLAIVGFFVLAIVVLGIVAYRSFRAHEPELRASAAKMQTEGKAYGAGKQPGDCVDEALRRADRGFTGQIRTRVFVDACLKAASPSPAYCANVPSGIIDTARWANAECVRRNLAGDQMCVQVHTAVGEYCHPSK
jgi:hypothetical protein